MNTIIEITGQLSGNAELRNKLQMVNNPTVTAFQNSITLSYFSKKEAQQAITHAWKLLRTDGAIRHKEGISYDASKASIYSPTIK